MRKSHTIAILVADLHLSLLKPACRAEGDWMEVQAGYLRQLKQAASDYSPGKGPLPILCAGDVFDRWNAPAELIHFALKHLPDEMVCVAGQHDLPHHRMDLMHRSAYGILKVVGKILDISENLIYVNPSFHIHVRGFGWEVPPATYEDPFEGIQVALVHRYIWEGRNKYPGAPETAQVGAYAEVLRGYHAAVFGDNHKGFRSRVEGCAVLNCGGFIRRKSDEIASRPALGLLYSDGSITQHWLDTSADKFLVPAKDPATPFNMQEFIDGLEQLGEHGLNFREAVENHLRGDKEMDPKVKQIILGAMEYE